jgi:twitching motility protein PilU
MALKEEIKTQILTLLNNLLGVMNAQKASDLFLTEGFPPAIKVDGKIKPISPTNLSGEYTKLIAQSIMNDKQWTEFNIVHESNFAIQPEGFGRYRVNVFFQQGHIGLVLRTINTVIPVFEELQLPEVLKDVVMNKRGLILFVGGTGSGKSTSLAALIDYRNRNSYDHIITIEDPIEFVHTHKKSIITQREIGSDTESWGNALKSALRQAPDVIFIGEIRDKEAMEYALNFSDTGHLCLATLHSNNANQALERIVNFFSEEKKTQILMDLSLNLRGIVSQRLIPKKEGRGRVPALEILLNSPFTAELISKGDIPQIKEIMKNSNEMGMQTFDQSLFELFEKDKITYKDALRNADSVTDLKLLINLKSNNPDKPKDDDTSNLSVLE